MSEMEALYQVQELDNRIFELRQREDNHPLKEELDRLADELEANRGRAEEKEVSLLGSRKKQGATEAEVQRIDEKLSREEGKLYGGKVNNPKELRGLEAEVLSLKRQKDALETRLLEEMEHQDGVKDDLDKLQAERSQLLAEVGEKKGVMDAETAEIASELADLEGRRDELCSQVDAELIALYTKLLESKHKLAVVKVIDAVCQGCRVELPGVEYDRFLKSEGVFRCTNCGRILVR